MKGLYEGYEVNMYFLNRLLFIVTVIYYYANIIVTMPIKCRHCEIVSILNHIFFY